MKPVVGMKAMAKERPLADGHTCSSRCSGSFRQFRRIGPRLTAQYERRDDASNRRAPDNRGGRLLAGNPENDGGNQSAERKCESAKLSALPLAGIRLLTAPFPLQSMRLLRLDKPDDAVGRAGQSASMRSSSAAAGNGPLTLRTISSSASSDFETAGGVRAMRPFTPTLESELPRWFGGVNAARRASNHQPLRPDRI